MSIKNITPALAFVVTAAALATPFLMADQKHDGSRPRHLDVRTSGEAQTPPGSTGWGKGSIVMPRGEETGMLVGVVTACDGPTKYLFEGELTGFMPSTGLSGGAQYWFGGMYGKMQMIANSEPEPGKDDIPWYSVEGMWVLDKQLEGSFTAQLLNCNGAGTQYVCGVIDGRFRVSDAMPGPAPPPGSEAMTFKFVEDRLPLQKPKVVGKGSADRESEGPVITCPKGEDPTADAVDPPKQPPTRGPAEEQLPCSAGARDLLSNLPPYRTPDTPIWPVLMGTFDLRYQLYE
jgi:hypothetical protein